MAIMDKLLRSLASAQANAIADLLIKDQAGWDRSQYELTHKRAQICLWTANGVEFLRLLQMTRSDPLYKKMSYVDRKLIWIHTKRFKWTDPTPGLIVKRVAEILAHNYSIESSSS